MLVVFSAWRELFAVNLFPLTTAVSSNVYCDVQRRLREMCDEKDRNFGAIATGSFIMTTRPPTRPRKPQSLWLTTTWLSFPILPTRRT
jgi:hypothetical protein